MRRDRHIAMTVVTLANYEYSIIHRRTFLPHPGVRCPQNDWGR